MMMIDLTILSALALWASIAEAAAEPKGFLDLIGIRSHYDKFSLGRFEAWKEDFLNPDYGMIAEYEAKRPKDPRLSCPKTLKEAKIILSSASGSYKTHNRQGGWYYTSAMSTSDLNIVSLEFNVNRKCGGIIVSTEFKDTGPYGSYDWGKPVYKPSHSLDSQQGIVLENLKVEAKTAFSAAKTKDHEQMDGGIKEVWLEYTWDHKQPIYIFMGKDSYRTVDIGALDVKKSVI